MDFNALVDRYIALDLELCIDIGIRQLNSIQLGSDAPW